MGPCLTQLFSRQQSTFAGVACLVIEAFTSISSNSGMEGLSAYLRLVLSLVGFKLWLFRFNHAGVRNLPLGPLGEFSLSIAQTYMHDQAGGVKGSKNVTD